MKSALLAINNKRLLDTLSVSSSIGATENGGLHRLALSSEDKQMRDRFSDWLKEAGLKKRVDDFGNIYGRREGRDPAAPPVVTGSHLDTQPNGGKYDGVLGVLTALEAVKTMNDHNIETERPIEIVNFTNEEGARFEPPMLGSAGITKNLTKDEIYNIEDRNGITFLSALQETGYQGDEENRLKNPGYFIELHIEQGPVMEENNIQIGVVEGIQGMTWLNVVVEGSSDHAGPTPMGMRHDALAAAAKMISCAEEISSEYDGLTTTVGKLQLHPNVINVIPGKVEFSIDVRHFNDEVRKQAIDVLRERLSTIAATRGVKIITSNFWNIDAITFSSEIRNSIEASAYDFGYSTMPVISGAGHDSKHMHEVTETGMIFLPSINGKSHCEEELTLDEDIEKGANVLLHTLLKLAGKTER
ncbi:M20 family metallo-hydrolase [Evansella sp. LMS18]|uniref:M20 family metallo-hydrolase n=1 Tax=Evansella sp. LMS18 TaxID=2924033 RepID=UPI0020D0DC93|nr:M20 family metallo-hydrolase [Evansella sp. LMS18]UTR11764.1 M20 family metallo-hydrolase [Evansella sp. LMS18]